MPAVCLSSPVVTILTIIKIVAHLTFESIVRNHLSSVSDTSYLAFKRQEATVRVGDSPKRHPLQFTTRLIDIGLSNTGNVNYPCLSRSVKLVLLYCNGSCVQLCRKEIDAQHSASQLVHLFSSTSNPCLGPYCCH